MGQPLFLPRLSEAQPVRARNAPAVGAVDPPDTLLRSGRTTSLLSFFSSMNTPERRRAAIARIQLRKQFERIAQQVAERRVLQVLALFLAALALVTAAALLLR